MSKTKTTAERFYAMVDTDGPTPLHCADLGPCHVWMGAVNHGGYGRFWSSGKGADSRDRRAHRVAYELANGELPGYADGLEISHLCGVARCVNPSHLVAETHTANVRRIPLHRAGVAA